MQTSVLLVDDDAAIREVLGQALRSEGYQVHAVESCTGALALLEHTRPSLVLLDLMMPVLGGWQFLEILNKSEKLSAIPVVIITAAEDVPRGRYRVVKKPFDVVAVLSAIEDAEAARS
jgi:CheY-like chemotaxis protein